MVSSIKRYWPLIVVLVMFWATIAILLILSISQNHGRLVYALDDSYIHMAMAKIFAHHGVWGVTQHEFTSSSSSPLWTLLLSLTYLLFGINEFTPLILNIICGTLLLVLAFLLLKKYGLRPFYAFIAMAAIIFLTPLLALVFCGQEHILHILLIIPLVHFSARLLSDQNSNSKGYTALLLSPFVTFTRYEGLFLIFFLCILFVARRQWVYSLLLGGLSIVPIAIYGIISRSHGWYFLPNSVLLNGNAPGLSLMETAKFFYHFGIHISKSPDILVLVCGALFLFIFHFDKRRTLWKDSTIMLMVFIATFLLHMLFARTSWFFRHEAYLVTLGVFVLPVCMYEYLPEKLQMNFDKGVIPKYIAIAILLLLVICPLAWRGLESLIKIPRATTNIYEQQYQMGLFVGEFYQEKAVAANDIGAINYMADIECFDLSGLANVEVGELRREENYHTQQIYNLTKQKHVKIAILYDDWFVTDKIGGIPPQWVKVGQWRILNNVVCGSDIVSFYAVDQSETDNLMKNLRAFSSRLPKDVMQSGEYTK